MSLQLQAEKPPIVFRMEQYEPTLSFSGDNNPKFKCMFNSLHVVTASKILLGLYVLVCLGVGKYSWDIRFQDSNAAPVQINLFTVGFPALIVAVTIFAFLQENRTLLLPFVIQSIVIFGLFLIFGCVHIAWFFFGLMNGFHNYEESSYFEYIRVSSSPTVMALFMLGTSIIFIAILVFLHWQMTVVFACQEFFEKKAEFKVSAAVASQSVAAQQYNVEGGIQQPFQPYDTLGIDDDKQEPPVCI